MGADPSGRGGVGHSVTPQKRYRRPGFTDSGGSSSILRWWHAWGDVGVEMDRAPGQGRNVFCFFVLFFFKKNDPSNKHKVRELSAAGLRVVPTPTRGHRSAASNSVRLPVQHGAGRATAP